MKKKLLFILLAVIVLLIVSLNIVGYIKHRAEVNVRTDTEESRRLLAQSHLADFEVNEEDILYGSIRAPWIIIGRNQDEKSGQSDWCILASDMKVIDAESLAAVKTVVIVRRSAETAAYQSTAGAKSTGTAEVAALCYFDVATGCYMGEDTLRSKPLPEKSTDTPHYTLSNRELAERVSERVKSTINPHFSNTALYIDDGNLRAYAQGVKSSVLGIPDCVHTILPGALKDFGPSKKDASISVYIPATVSQIGENAFAQGVTLIVEHNSYAEDYAQQNGFCYRYPGSQELYGRT